MEPFEYTLLPRDIRREIMGQAEPVSRRRLAQITREPPTIEDCCMLPSTKELVDLMSKSGGSIMVIDDYGSKFFVKKRGRNKWFIGGVGTKTRIYINSRDELYSFLRDKRLFFPYTPNIEAYIEILKRRRICQELELFLETCVYSYLYYEVSEFDDIFINRWEQIYLLLQGFLPAHLRVMDVWDNIRDDITSEARFTIGRGFVDVLTQEGVEEMRRRTLEVLDAIGPEYLEVMSQ